MRSLTFGIHPAKRRHRAMGRPAQGLFHSEGPNQGFEFETPRVSPHLREDEG